MSLDPRAKIISLIVLVPTVLTARSGAELACHALLLAACAFVSGAGRVSARLVPAALLALFTFMLGVPSLMIGGVGLGDAASRACFTASRLFIGVSLAALLPLTAEPHDIADGLGQLMRPLGRLGLPVGEISAVTGLAIGFIPMMTAEARRIMRAQISRGALIDCGGPAERVRAFVSVLAPLVINSLRRGDELAMALESRGFMCGEERTRMRPLLWGPADTCAVILSLCFAAVCAAARSS